MAQYAKDLLLTSLNRPEYVPYPEGFLSDMYWSFFKVAGWEEREPDPDNRLLGLIYDADGQGGSSKVSLHPTRPSNGDGRWRDGLRRSGISLGDHPDLVAEAIASSVLGVRSPKAKRRPATPLSPNIALLQNLHGIFLKTGPPNLSRIIEAMYRIGATSRGIDTSQSDSAVVRLVQAAQRRIARDDFLYAINDAVRMGIFPSETVETRRVEDASLSLTEGVLLPPENPYVWFYENWKRLTSDEWVDVLPARRWSDWATAAIRTAVGFGFLWEMKWCETIARQVIAVSNGASSEGSLIQMHRRMHALPVMDWEPGSSSVERRDVASSMKALVERGVSARRILIEATGTSSEESVDTAVSRIAGDAETVEKLISGLEREEGPTSPAKNLWESVRYALGVREESGSFADYYGVLRRRGRRYLLVDPDTEWIAMIASLTCKSPSQMSTLSEVRSELWCLGLRPSVSELLEQLTRSGLARSSPDADDAVYVEAAFNE